MNKTMIICMDYDINRHIHITDIMYDERQPYIDAKEFAKSVKEYHREVYMVDINNYVKEFINAIRKGCDKI